MTPNNPYKNCILCPRKCGIDRTLGKVGFCGQSADLKIARAALHYWEEPSISGAEGSGAIFFSGCNLGCVFCQNYEISSRGVGYEISVEELSENFLRLQEEGANNINLVTAVPHAPKVIAALDFAKGQGLKIPVVYNSSGYESIETLKMFDGYVDIYLPDLKYLSEPLAGKLSAAADYPEVAKAAIQEMFRQTGSPVFANRQTAAEQNVSGESEDKKHNTSGEAVDKNHNTSGEPQVVSDEPLMIRGTIVRHLVLPGHVKNAKEVLEYLYRTYGNNIYISIMSQFTPIEGLLGGYPELNRRITEREYDRVVDFALALGIENAYIQEREVAKESFIPDFTSRPRNS